MLRVQVLLVGQLGQWDPPTGLSTGVVGIESVLTEYLPGT